MKSIEEFLADVARCQGSPSAGTASHRHNHQALPDPVREAANRGWHVFPVSPLAKLMENPDLLIGEATNDISRLEELAAEYPSCDWRVAVGPSSLCIVQSVGQQGRNAFAALSDEQGEFLTLQAQRGDIACAFFRWPKGLKLRKSSKKLPTNVSILADGVSCIIPPSGGSFYVNPWADVEAVPSWLRELAFEIPDTPPANAVPVPAPPSCPVPCRTRTRFEKPHRGTRKGYSVSGQAGWRGGYRIYRQR